MDPNDIASLSKLLHDHAWLALALLIVTIADKALSPDEWPLTLVASVKARLALLAILGGGVVALQHAQSGDAWMDAVLSGVLVVVFAAIKNGRSLFAPRFAPPMPIVEAPAPDIVRGAPVRIVGIELDDAAPTRPIPPDSKSRGLTRLDVMAFAMTLGLLGTALLGLACGGWKREAKTVIDVATTVCVIANGMSTNAEIMAICGIEQALAPGIDQILAEHRAQMKASALRVCR